MQCGPDQLRRFKCFSFDDEGDIDKKTSNIFKLTAESLGYCFCWCVLLLVEHCYWNAVNIWCGHVGNVDKYIHEGILGKKGKGECMSRKGVVKQQQAEVNLLKAATAHEVPSWTAYVAQAPIICYTRKLYQSSIRPMHGLQNFLNNIVFLMTLQ